MAQILLKSPIIGKVEPKVVQIHSNSKNTAKKAKKLFSANVVVFDKMPSDQKILMDNLFKEDK